MPKTASNSLTTTGSTPATGILTLTPDQSDNLAVFQIGGTYGTVQFVFEGSQDETRFFPIVATSMLDHSLASGTLSPSDNTTRAWKLVTTGCAQVRLRITAIASGTVEATSNSFASVGTQTIQSVQTSATSGSTTNITSTSSTAFTVGINGTTAPVFTVDNSTSSAATGIQVKGAAAAAGVAVTVTSSGTNEALTVDAKGSGTITIGASSTGSVVLGQSGSTLTVAGSTGLVTILKGITVSGAACSLNTSSNFNTTINTGTSTGTVGIGNSLAGALTIASGAASTVTVTGANLTISTASSGTLAVTSAGLLTLTGVGASVWTPGAGATIVSDATTGIQVGTATTQKLGFFAATPVVQPVANSDTTTGATGSATGVSLDTTFKGNGGTSQFTIGGILTKLKLLGLLAA